MGEGTKVCTCIWRSLTNTISVDPLHILIVNPECPIHGEPEAYYDGLEDQ